MGRVINVKQPTAMAMMALLERTRSPIPTHDPSTYTTHHHRQQHILHFQFKLKYLCSFTPSVGTFTKPPLRIIKDTAKSYIPQSHTYIAYYYFATKHQLAARYMCIVILYIHKMNLLPLLQRWDIILQNIWRVCVAMERVLE